MSDEFIVSSICLRCGYQNQKSLVLSNKKDNTIYHCDNCNFIILTSWMETK